MDIRRAAVFSVLASLAALQAGCLVTSGNAVQEEGTRVSATTLEQVVPGQTTEAWVIAALGEPSARTPVEGMPTRQILRYDYRRVEASSGTVLFLFAGGSKREQSSRAFFEVTDGIVTRYWQEN